MCVRRNRDLQTELFCLLAMNVIEIEARRVSVELKEAAASLCSLHHLVEIDRIARPFAKQAPGRVSNNVAITIVHGVQDALGLGLCFEVKLVVDGADREIEPLQDVIGKIERAIGPSVRAWIL